MARAAFRQGEGGGARRRERRSWGRPQERLGPDPSRGGCPGFLKLPKNISGRVKLLARLAAVVLGTEKVAGLDALGREYEQVGGYAPPRGGQGERDFAVKCYLPSWPWRPIFEIRNALQA
jgi:hypothetical protein